MRDQAQSPEPRKPVPYLSKTRIKKEWAKLDLPDPERPSPSEEQTALNELYEDDLFGLGNE